MTHCVKHYYLFCLLCTIVLSHAIWRYIKDYFSVAFSISCQMCDSVLQHMPKMWMEENRIHSCGCREKSEGGYKLMLNMSSEEQQALKPITRCTKITVDLTHEEKLLFLCSNKKHWGPRFSQCGCELFCFLNIVIMAFPFTAVIPWREQSQTWRKRYIRCDVLQISD